MIDLLDPFAFEESRGFFAADTSSAEHRDPGWLACTEQAFALTDEPLWKIAKRGGLRIDRPCEGADLDLVIIARVDHDGVWIVDQFVPVLRVDICARLGGGVNIGSPHRHDFALEAHLQPMKRRLRSGRELHFEIGAVGPRADVRQHAIDGAA